MGWAEVSKLLQRRASKLNCLLALVVIISSCLYAHLHVIRFHEVLIGYEPWLLWEKASENELPDLDIRISEDNSNQLKWFNDAKHASQQMPTRSKTVSQRTNQTLFETNLPRTILLFDLSLEEHAVDDVSCGKRCDVITNTSFLRHTDVVVFDGSKLNRDDIPDKIHPNQLYVWYNEDSTAGINRTLNQQKIDLKKFDGVFDLTMSYRSDSDIVFSKQGAKLAELDVLADQYFDYMHRYKSRMAYWIPHHCAAETASWSMDIMYQLHVMRFTVDVIGDLCPDVTQQQQQNTDPQIYNFYVHFSSAPGCRDFIDDEVWTRGLYVGVVPVIFGVTESDLRRRLPRNSYISPDQFASAYELVNYLQYLQHDYEAYKQYFIWRFNPAPPPPPVPAMCELCKAVYPFPKEPTVESLEEWLFEAEPPQCLELLGVTVKDFNFYRQYVHLSYFIDSPMGTNDLHYMLVTILVVAVIALVLLFALNLSVIRRLRVYIFVSSKLVIIGQLLIELAKAVWNRKGRCSSAAAGYYNADWRSRGV